MLKKNTPKEALTTKVKISEAALFLFNHFGFVNVRLQHIADEAGLSVGNLAYHFKTKDEIVDFLYEEIVTRQKNLLSDLRMIPLFINLNTYINNTFLMQKRYSFFFTDTLEIMRSSPVIRKKHREHIQWQMIQLTLYIQFNIARGAFHTFELPDTIENFSSRFILLTDSWIGYQMLQGEKISELDSKQFNSALWGMTAPNFSQAGKNEFAQMYAYPYDELA
ncbi:TetR/AcrR family transcriptional regulator [Dyadobacter sp. 3J3]|uniref:TetR/AcrR family transcriptional regulator n=1 Tax=Dyadobacter sp. 3J3 TaxID=2606600 RepID=UPI001E5F8484|nr:TetR/AcrR family transcriptional regulator [Dyadobacter sp. 3J3]